MYGANINSECAISQLTNYARIILKDSQNNIQLPTEVMFPVYSGRNGEELRDEAAEKRTEVGRRKGRGKEGEKRGRRLSMGGKAGRGQEWRIRKRDETSTGERLNLSDRCSAGKRWLLRRKLV